MPDDLLQRQGEGFKIVGRVSDVINVAGKKVNPAEVEAQLLRVQGVQQAVVFGRESTLRNEEVVACVVSDGEAVLTSGGGVAALRFDRRPDFFRGAGWHRSP